MSQMQQPSYGQPSYYGGGYQNPHPQYYPPPTDPKYNQKNYQYSQYPQYPPPSVPPPSFTQSMDGGVGNIDDNNTDTNDKFHHRPQYRDLWAAILFLLHFAAFVAVSVIALRNYAVIQRSGSESVQKVTLNLSTILLLFVCVGVGLVLSIIYLALAERFPKRFIKVTLFISIISYWGMVIYFYISSYFSMAIFTTIVAVFYSLSWFWWKPLIPFSSVILKTVTDITKRYKSMILVAFGGVIAETLYNIWWIFTFIAAYQIWYPEACNAAPNGNNLPAAGGCQTGKIVVIVIFLLFSFYWTSQVIQTWVHVTTSGVFATYYFLEGTPGGVPSSPTLKSSKRASTTSFGSICFGSLIVAILQVIRSLLRVAVQDSDNPFFACCAACAAMIVDMIDSLLEYFNFYAYTQVAIYGKSFRESARDTWKLIKDRGVEAVINDNLIGNVLTMGAILVGIVTALLSYLYIIIFNRIDSGFTLLVVFLGFIIGFQMMSTMGSVIFSGTTTTFVCLAEDPDVLARTKPELYDAIRATYPRFIIGV